MEYGSDIMQYIGRCFILFTMIVVAFICSGYFYGSHSTDLSQLSHYGMMPALRPVTTLRSPAADKLESFRYILSNNTKVLLSIFAGIASFGILGFSIIAFNGFKIGLICFKAHCAGLSISTILRLTLPHGIFEYLSYFMAQAIAMQVSIICIRYLRGHAVRIRPSLLVLGVVAFLTLILAAWLEAFVTPALR
jgi:uncharacterized membrane protein SpoIIM required for sporulation